MNGAVNGKVSYGNIIVIPGAPKSTGKGAASTITEPITTASREMAQHFRENVLPGLRVDLATAEKESRKLFSKITNGALAECEQAALRVRLIENQRQIEIILPMLEGAPTFWVSNTTSEAMAIQFARNRPLRLQP